MLCVSAGGESTSSTQTSERLSTGALVLQLELKGDRLHYQLRRLPGKRKGGWFQFHRVDLRKMKEMSSQKGPFQQANSLPTVIFQGLCEFWGSNDLGVSTFFVCFFRMMPENLVNVVNMPWVCGEASHARKLYVSIF